ncbi:hypothetical protein COCNU_12G002730 [Cocos nucifera]|uniref:Di19 C-terminal domain-containing protein n=1 Tax=Cocos nucifera TaxID=13894 RepID=A0A8K0IRA5_COCNU|nr:hypothetical protein COCNU_12G002730 [Cocos nucifera]
MEGMRIREQSFRVRSARRILISWGCSAISTMSTRLRRKMGRRFRKGSSGSHSTLSLLRKDLQEGNLQSLFGGSSYTVASSDAAPDPLLSSFIFNFPVADSSKDVKPGSLNEQVVINKTSDEKAVESVVPSLSKKDQAERTRRSKFVQELVLSTIFGDSL